MSRNMIWKIISPPGTRFFIDTTGQIYLEFHPTQMEQILAWSQQQHDYFIAMSGRVGDGTKHDEGYLIAMKQAGMKLPEPGKEESITPKTVMPNGVVIDAVGPIDPKMDPGYLIAMQQAKALEPPKEPETVTTEKVVIGNVMETKETIDTTGTES